MSGTSPKPWLIDTALAAFLSVGTIVDLLTFPQQFTDAAGFRPVDAGAIALALAQTLPLAVRRRYPTTVLLAISTAFVVDRSLGYPSSLAVFGLMFAFHAVGSELPRRKAQVVGWTAIAVLVLFTVSGAFFTEQVNVGTVLIMVIFTGFPFLLGREVHDRRAESAHLEAQAIRMELERDAQARRAVREERERIARELHDIVAHEMTVMTLQSAAAKRLIGRDPGRARQALDAAETAGHEGLAEMRRLLGLLRSDDAASLAPQPGVDRIPDLVQQTTEAGKATTYRVEGEPFTLPPGIDLNAYRIVQEALTNVLRHAGPDASARVVLRYETDHLGVVVDDDGRGLAADPNGVGSGHGLVGMRERIAMLGGRLDAGPRPGGGYRVHARIPVTAR